MVDDDIRNVADQYSRAADEHRIDIFRIYAAALRLKALCRNGGEPFERRPYGSRRIPGFARDPSHSRAFRSPRTYQYSTADDTRPDQEGA